MKRISQAEQTIIGVPVVLKPIEVQDPPIVIPVKIGHVQVAVSITPDLCKISSIPLPVEPH